MTGLIQAYIFAVLAMVYIASATQAHREREEKARSLYRTESANDS